MMTNKNVLKSVSLASILLFAVQNPTATAAKSGMYFDLKDNLIHYAAKLVPTKSNSNRTTDGRLLKLTLSNVNVASTMSPGIPVLTRTVNGSFRVDFKVYGKNSKRSYNTLDSGYQIVCAFNFNPSSLSDSLLTTIVGLPLASFESFTNSLSSGGSSLTSSITAGSTASLNNFKDYIKGLLTPNEALVGNAQAVANNQNNTPSGFRYNLSPGKIQYINYLKNSTLGTFGGGSIKDSEITVENCLGPLTVKPYARLTSSTDHSSDYVEVVGDSIDIWI